MGIAVYPPASAAGKTMYRETLVSGTSYTVPAGVTYLNVTLIGGGGGGGGGTGNVDAAIGFIGLPGRVISSTLSATAGGSIAYAIGAGGTGGSGAGNATSGAAGGDTTFTGATTAAGGNGGTAGAGGATAGTAGTNSLANNGGSPGSKGAAGGAGGAGMIIVEYWV